ncbi:twin-arginine translocase subunit TatC [Aeromonas jandaei]|uniref:twin-arginine translocase subunit TatC n=1 Tax=Aeromonas jandaei TaxID=650 RepID=UPI001ABF8A47|nr:twin-arginine translocase subunit TatC [Aeromonas jandaei]QSR71971.1 twin-arginine translocase subunit TatC [Aeromonas jandaei]
MSYTPLLAHLRELRTRLGWALSALVLVFVGMVNWSRDIYHLIAQPLLQALPIGTSMIATDVTGAFFVPIKVTMMVAFLVTLPHTLYQAWSFIAPGLYRHEKHLILPFISSCFFLFLLGMVFAYMVVFPVMFTFISSVTPEGVRMMTDIEKYLSFVLSTFLTFGLAFEVPVVVTVLVYLGILTVRQIKEARAYVMVGAFVVAAIVTPPDVLSQALLALPLCLLYEVGILIANLIARKKIPQPV